MAERATALATKASATTPAAPVLRRKCGCGTHTHGERECAECSKVRRTASDHAAPSQAPPIVHDVIGSAGRPLDADTRRWMEPRFGADFGHVRIHDDSRAAESARSVGALAYAAGSHLVFDHQQFAPGTAAGRHLLAHELAHTIQDPGASGVHASLAIGSADDATEVAADRAADAVSRGESVTVSPTGGGVVRRQMRGCSASQGDGPDVQNVHCPDGSDTRVTMTRVPGAMVPGFHSAVTPGISASEIWLDIELCNKQTEVHIRPSVDIPKALASTIANLVAGSDSLKGVSLNPTLKFTIVQSQSYTLSIGPSVKLDQGGFAGVGATGKLETGGHTYTGGVNYDPHGHATMFTFQTDIGKATGPVDCKTKGKEKISYACEKITHVPAVPEVPAETATDVQTRYVFFRHARHDVRKDFRLPTDIPTLNEQGYRVTSIKGFTSPEGPRGDEHAPLFEGNVALANERAQAALDWLGDPKVCGGCDLSGVTRSGESELPPEQGKQEPEPKGRAMEHGAVDEFLGKTGKADPLAPSDPAERQAFERQAFTRQRNQAFDLMRRAAIVFERTRTVRERQPGIPAKDVPGSVACDPQVVEVAAKAFGVPTQGAFNFDKPGTRP